MLRQPPLRQHALGRLRQDLRALRAARRIERLLALAGLQFRARHAGAAADLGSHARPSDRGARDADVAAAARAGACAADAARAGAYAAAAATARARGAAAQLRGRRQGLLRGEVLQCPRHSVLPQESGLVELYGQLHPGPRLLVREARPAHASEAPLHLGRRGLHRDEALLQSRGQVHPDGRAAGAVREQGSARVGRRGARRGPAPVEHCAGEAGGAGPGYPALLHHRLPPGLSRGGALPCSAGSARLHLPVRWQRHLSDGFGAVHPPRVMELPRQHGCVRDLVEASAGQGQLQRLRLDGQG
mmetsp:Transcript_70414/g.204189  ORF Transcript_70414/g.204189 Transcript_70414/m.204189 type:complete len:302 (+) Transcript_70414:536-1441(+)